MNELFLSPANAFGEVFDPNPAPLHMHLGAEQRDHLLDEAALKLGRYRSFSTILGAAAVRRLMPLDPERHRGVVAVGGQISLDVGWSFAEKIASGGGDLVNPVAFPATLASACAADIAAFTGSHAFAITIGTDETAFVEALAVARTLIHGGDADEILLVAALDAGQIFSRACRELGRPSPQSVALAFLVQAMRPDDRMSIGITFQGEAETFPADTKGGWAPNCPGAPTYHPRDVTLGSTFGAVSLIGALLSNYRARATVRSGGYSLGLAAETLATSSASH